MIILVGAGPMAQAYAHVLKSLGKEFAVIGRGKESVAEFYSKTGVEAVLGGLEKFLSDHCVSNVQAAIVTTGVEQLHNTTELLLNVGVRRFLVEKPAGLDGDDIRSLAEKVQRANADVFVAYNRRFYSSVQEAKQLIEEDGGPLSFNFELTEWGHVIQNIPKAQGVKENWFLGNTTHVADLAFFLGGKPKEISTFTSGSSDWHSRSYNFSGAGVAENGALFSYSGNWGAPGRWRVEVLTKKRRFIFSPLEKLQVQNLGSVQQEFVEIDDTIDTDFKAGLYEQTRAFINNDLQDLCDLEEHCELLNKYEMMAGYAIKPLET